MRSFDLKSKTGSVYGLETATMGLPDSHSNVMCCTIAAGMESHGHNHSEFELFYFPEGPVHVSNGTAIKEVPQGCAVLFEPYEPHIIINPNSDRPLDFLSMYWPAEQSAERTDTAQRVQRDTLVFATPPTPNGDLHLGHLSGPYLAGDVLTRALRQRGHRAWYGSGRDDHQTYVAYKAMTDGSTPSLTAATYAGQIQETWDKAGIKLDGFTVPDQNGDYAAFIREGVSKLFDVGLVIEKEAPAAFDANGTYLHEAFIEGICPHCKCASDGNACEACGRPNDCVDLGNIKARMTDAQPHIRAEKRLYFRLSALSSRLTQYVRIAQMPAKVVNLCSQMLEDGLPDICVSHPGDWGISHDISGHTHSKIYVWFEMAFGYLWQAAEYCQDETDRWARVAKIYDGSRDIVHAYGFDNAYYHALLFPAVYLGLNLKMYPPRVHIVNELLDLEGSKFSTSRGHLIWARDFLKEVPIDYTRFALSYCRPEGLRSNFQPHQAIELVNAVFAEELSGWVDQIKRTFTNNSRVPESGAWSADQRAFFDAMRHAASQIERSLSVDTFSPRLAAFQVHALISLGAHFAKAQEPLLLGDNPRNANHKRTSQALLVYGLHVLARSAEPIIPNIAGQLCALLSTSSENSEFELLPAGHQLNLNVCPKFPSVSSFLVNRSKETGIQNLQSVKSS